MRDRRALERRVAPPRRAARPFACPASPCSAPRSCHPGLVQTLVGPTQCGCAKCKTHLLPLCSGRRPSMPLCLARRHRLCRTSCTTRARPCPAAGRLAEPLQPPCSAVARRCTGTARGSPEKPVGKKKSQMTGPNHARCDRRTLKHLCQVRSSTQLRIWRRWRRRTRRNRSYLRGDIDPALANFGIHEWFGSSLLHMPGVELQGPRLHNALLALDRSAMLQTF